jgi:hypothetical protein
MGRANKRSWLGAAVILLLIVGSASAVYAFVGHESQPFVIRVATLLILAIVLMQIHNRVRSNFDSQPPSRFKLELDLTPAEAKVDPRLRELHRDLQNSLASRSYFERVFWAHLTALAKRNGITLEPPPTRWLPGRGPSLRTIADLIARIERKE